MNPQQLDAIDFTVETIEAYLDKPLRLDELSKKVGISKYHLLRLFKSIADKSLMSYVRARRLSLSIFDLINTNMNILDIAIKYQFEYEQSYIRAFQSQFHITPAKYRRLKAEISIEQKIDMHNLKIIGQGLVVKPKMVIKPEIFVQGIKTSVNHEINLAENTGNKLGLDFFQNHVMSVPNSINHQIYLGIVLYSDTPNIMNDYMPSVQTSVLNKVEPPYAVFTIPSQEYAVFRYVGFHAPTEVTYATLKELYSYTDTYWQLNTGYRQTHPFHFECMDVSVCSETYCEMDIYYPISI